MTPSFIPPDFAPLEFAGRLPEAHTRRWFCDFQGALDQPAGEIVLGWVAAGAVVLCATARTATYPTPHERGLRALQLLWGGSDLVVGGRPTTPAAFREAAEAASADSDRWNSVATIIDDLAVAPSRQFVADGGWAGEAVLPGGLLLLVAGTGDAPRELAFRGVSGWHGYGIDLSRSWTLPELDAYRAALAADRDG